MKSELFIGKRDKIEIYKCIFCLTEYKNKSSKCQCEHAIEFSRIKDGPQAEAYKRQYAKVFIEKTGKHTIHKLNSLGEYDKFLEEKRVRREENKRIEQELQEKWKRETEEYKRRSEIEGARRTVLEEKRLLDSNRVLKDSTLKELIDGLKEALNANRYCRYDELVNDNFRDIVTVDELIEYIDKNYEDLISAEIERRDYDEIDL